MIFFRTVSPALDEGLFLAISFCKNAVSVNPFSDQVLNSRQCPLLGDILVNGRIAAGIGMRTEFNIDFRIFFQG